MVTKKDGYIAAAAAEVLYFVLASNPVVWVAGWKCYYCGHEQEPFTKVNHNIGCIWVKAQTLDGAIRDYDDSGG